MGAIEAAGPPVSARGLVKRYGDLAAVDAVDMTVAAGDVYGYLGPNGAGKTTSLRMMLGLIRPTAGTVELFGRSPLALGRRALEGVAGFVEEPRFYPYLSGRKNLELLAAYDGDGARGRIGEVLDTVDLTERAGDRVGRYSHGMKQRLGIAASLLRRPRLLILDEPNTGLDPAGMRDMKTLLRRLADEGITVLLSSHQMADVEELCNRVAIINRGRILYEGDVAGLKRSVGAFYRLRVADPDAAAAVAADLGIGEVTRRDGELRVGADEASIERLSVALGKAGIGVRALIPQEATLEELFFRLTEGGDGDAPAAAPEADAVTAGAA